jgi:hypothetical protein
VAEATLGDRRSHLLPVVLAEVVQTRRADVPGMTASIVIRRPASSMAAERMNPMPRPMPLLPSVTTTDRPETGVNTTTAFSQLVV